MFWRLCRTFNRFQGIIKYLSNINSVFLWCGRPGCMCRRDAGATNCLWTSTERVGGSGRLALGGAEIERESLRGRLGSDEAGQQLLQPLDARDNVHDLFVAA